MVNNSIVTKLVFVKNLLNGYQMLKVADVTSYQNKPWHFHFLQVSRWQKVLEATWCKQSSDVDFSEVTVSFEKINGK